MSHRVQRLVGAAVVVTVRLWASWTARVPQVVADETAYLAMARYLAGGPKWNLGESASYMPLYSVVIAPGEALGLAPDAVYRWAVLTNVVLAALTFLAVEALARRTTPLTGWAPVAVAALATSLPALVLSTRFAWSDNLAPLLFAVIALTGLRLLDDPTPRRVAVFVASGITGYAAHSRFLTVMAVMAVALVVLAVRRVLGRGVVAAALAVMAVGVVAADLALERLAAELNMSGREASEFSRILQIDDLAISVLGQLWYLTVTTGGLALVGGLVIAEAGWRRWRSDRQRHGDGDQAAEVIASADASVPSDPAGASVPAAAGPPAMRGGEVALLIGLIGISFATSAGFMTDRPRPDHLVYGRYNDMFVAPLVVIGLAALVTVWSWRRALVATGLALAVTGLTAQLLWSQRLEILTASFMPGTIMGLFALDPLATQRIRSIALVAAVVIVVISVTTWVAHAVDQRWIALAGCAALLVVALTRAHDTYVHRYVQPDPSAVSQVEPVLRQRVPDGESIVCAMTAGCPLLNFYRYQFYLPDRDIDLTWDESWRDHDVVLAGKEGADADLLVDLGYEMVWGDPSSHGALWLR